MKNLFLLLIVFTLLVGCGSTRKIGPRGELTSTGLPKYYSLNVDGVNKIEFDIKREELVRRLALADAVYKIRLVELYGAKEETPRYRVMGFDKSGVYGLLGLKEGDYILAASNFIIYTQELFPKFIELLPAEKEASIHVLRNGSELLLHYNIN